MDVMNPQLEWIDGMCYRINQIDFGNYTAQYRESYNDDEISCALEAPEDDVEGVTVDENGRCRTSFHVPSMFFAYLIGTKGATKKNLEYETRTQIIIPKQGKDGDIVVSGADQRSVASARNRILMMVKGARSRKKPTHFISVPLTSGIFVKNFLDFKSSVLENCRDRGVDEKIFISENKLHLTICVFVISDEVERKEAAAALRRCKEIVVDPILEKNPLKLKVEGLDYMNDDPSEVHVLYANVSSEDSILQTLMDQIKTFFSDIPTTKQEQRKDVKIHATLMNSRYRNGEEERDTSRRESFDARNIIKMYEGFQFGEDFVERIDLSIMHTTSQITGFYNATESISLA